MFVCQESEVQVSEQSPLATQKDGNELINHLPGIGVWEV